MAGKRGILSIGSVKGEASLVPEKRDYIITFCGIKDAQVMGKVVSDGERVGFVVEKKRDFTVLLKNVSANEDIILFLQGRVCRDNEVTDRCFQILDRAEIEYALKENIFDLIENQNDAACLLGRLLALELNHDLYSALAEIIIA